MANYEALIMVVDDNPEYLKGVTFTLEMEGFKVWKAMNGQEALDILEAAVAQNTSGSPEVPDLILADIMMPVMDGYEFYNHVRANPFTNHIPFIFLSAKDSEDDIRFGKELGIDDYLTKLSTSEDLLSSIRGKLNRVKQRQDLVAQYSGGQQTSGGQSSGTANGSGGGTNIWIWLIILLVLIGVFIIGIMALTGSFG